MNPHHYRLFSGSTVVLLNSPDRRTWWWVVTDHHRTRAVVTGRSSATNAADALTDMVDRVGRRRVDLMAIEAMALRGHVHVPAWELRHGDLIWLERDVYARVALAELDPVTGMVEVLYAPSLVRGVIDDDRVETTILPEWFVPRRVPHAQFVPTDLCNLLTRAEEESA